MVLPVAIADTGEGVFSPGCDCFVASRLCSPPPRRGSTSRANATADEWWDKGPVTQGPLPNVVSVEKPLDVVDHQIRPVPLTLTPSAYSVTKKAQKRGLICARFRSRSCHLFAFRVLDLCSTVFYAPGSDGRFWDAELLGNLAPT
jgi:hypothetical protein